MFGVTECTRDTVIPTKDRWDISARSANMTLGKMIIRQQMPIGVSRG